MSVIESPAWHDWPIPPLGPKRFGHFILFRLDTKASVAALEDDAASRAAALLPQDWFLCIIMANGLENAYNPDGRARLNFRFSFVGVGLPDPAHASVPIAPAAQVLESRPPIALSWPPPWSNLYVHTHSPPSGVISRIQYGSTPLAGSLDQGQLDGLDDCVLTDNYNLSRLRAKQQRAAMEAKQQMAAMANDESENSSPNGRTRNSFESGHGSEFSSIDEVSLDDDMQAKFDQLRLYIELSLDSTVCPGMPADPALYKQRAAEVEDIWFEWQERMLREILAKRPLQTSDWIQGVENARNGPLEDEAPLIPNEGPLDDFAVLPEHAIDSFVEQARISRGSFDSSVDLHAPAVTIAPGRTSPATNNYDHDMVSGSHPQLGLVNAGAENAAASLVPLTDPPVDAPFAPLADRPTGSPADARAGEDHPHVARDTTANNSPPPQRSGGPAVTTYRKIVFNLRSTYRRVKTHLIRGFGKKASK